MNIKIVAIITLIFCSLAMSAQVYKKDISELLTLTSYEKDKDADAFYVYDQGSSSFIQGEDGLDILYERGFRMKVLNDDGVDHAEVSIPIYVNGYQCERIIDFRVIVCNLEDGKISKLKVDKSDLLEERLGEHWIAQKMKIPGVQAGSVIDVGYTIISPFLFNLPDWEFQHDIPVAYSLYQTAMIPFYTYTYILKGTNKLDIAQNYISTGMPKSYAGVEYQEMIFKFGLYNVKAFKDADFITCEEDYKITLDFQLTSYKPISGGEIMVMSTWEKLIRDFQKEQSFGRYQNSVKKLAKKAIETSSIIGETPQKTVENAVDYVKQNYRWDGYYGYFSNKKAKELEKEKTGNSTALNLFLVTLLNEAGIDASPVMISTRDHGRIYSDYPFAHFFNYTIVYASAGEVNILADATEPFADYNQLPVRCLNDKGLLIKKGKVEWVSTSSNTNSSTIDHFHIKVGSDSMNVEYNYNSRGYEAIKDFRSFTKDSIGYNERISENIFDNLIDAHSRNSLERKRFSIVLIGNKKLEKIDRFVAINPFLNYFSNENPFTERERDYPIDFIYPRKVGYVSVIDLPVNAKVISMPENRSISNEAFDLEYLVVSSDNELSITMNYQIKKSMYPKEQYAKFKEYFDEYLSAMAQTIQLEFNE